MKKILWLVYTVVFAILYAAAFSSFATAVEEGNVGNFLLMLPILGVITVVHYASQWFFNLKAFEKDVFVFDKVSSFKEDSPIVFAIAVVASFILSPVAALVSIFAHVYLTVLIFVPKKDKTLHNYSYKPTPSAPKPAPSTPKPSTPKSHPTVEKSNYDFYELRSAIQNALGNGRASVTYGGGYCFSATMGNFNTYIYDNREIYVKIEGTIRFKIDQNAVANALENGKTLDMIRNDIDRDTDELIDVTGKRLIERAKHAATMYEKENGRIPKSIDFNAAIGVEAVD